jgi:hypothetical protein
MTLSVALEEDALESVTVPSVSLLSIADQASGYVPGSTAVVAERVTCRRPPVSEARSQLTPSGSPVSSTSLVVGAVGV